MPGQAEVRAWLTQRGVPVTADNMNRASAIMYQNDFVGSGANATADRLSASSELDRLYEGLNSRSGGAPAPAARASGGGRAGGRAAAGPARPAAPPAGPSMDNPRPGTPLPNAAAATPAAPTSAQAAARASLPPVLQPELEPAMRNRALRAMAGLPPLPANVEATIAATEAPAQSANGGTPPPASAAAPPSASAPPQPTDDGRPAPAPGPGAAETMPPPPATIGQFGSVQPSPGVQEMYDLADMDSDEMRDANSAWTDVPGSTGSRTPPPSDREPWIDTPGAAGSQSVATHDPNMLTPNQQMVLAALGGGALLGGGGYAMMRNPPNVPGSAALGPRPTGPAAPPMAGPGPAPPPLRPPPIPVAPTPPPIGGAGATTVGPPPIPTAAPPIPSSAAPTAAPPVPPAAGPQGVRGSVGPVPPPPLPPTPITPNAGIVVRGHMPAAGPESPIPRGTERGTVGPMQSEMTARNLSNIPPPRVRGQPIQQSDRGRFNRGGTGSVTVPASAARPPATGGRIGGGGGQKPAGARGVLPQPWWQLNNPLS